MKLSTAEIQRIEEETGSTAVPPENPAIEQLKGHFGDHTFFVDGDGLHVWESPEEQPVEGGKMVGLRVATWKDESKTTLVPHEPTPTAVLEPSGDEPSDPAA